MKPCKMTQLDETFWRVDYGAATRILRSDSSGRFWYEDHGCNTWWPSLDDALAAHGLTRHDPNPETAEERLRAADASDSLGEYVSRMTGRADVFTVLAELDRLRAREAKFALGPSSEAVLAPIRRVLLAYRTAPAYGMKYELLARHVVDDLGQAIAEAEKIGRGE